VYKDNAWPWTLTLTLYLILALSYTRWTIFQWRHAYTEVWLLLHRSCLGPVRGSTHCQMYYVLWENPTSTHIPVCKLCLEIATHERTALFVEQRECFHLPFVATSCDLPSPRYSLLEITLSLQNAHLYLSWWVDLA